ncbi:MAG: T9SS type A sorting domain-containing protein [Chlorobi bacterium]|nr:T9SS type A sorting domain-containing protein [Chlorobiota bacterium]
MKFSDGEERMVQGVGFKGHSEYIEVSGGPVTVRCLQAGGGKVLFESRGILPYDSTYTLLLTGMEKRKTLGSTLLNDSYSGLQRPMVQFSTVATGAEAEVKGVRGVGIWPNPSRDEFVVEYVSSGRGEDRIEVVDLFGRVVLRREVGAGIVGERLVGVRTEGLSSGSYRVRVIDGAGMEVGSGGVMVVK